MLPLYLLLDRRCVGVPMLLLKRSRLAEAAARITSLYLVFLSFRVRPLVTSARNLLPKGASSAVLENVRILCVLPASSLDICTVC